MNYTRLHPLVVAPFFLTPKLLATPVRHIVIKQI